MVHVVLFADSDYSWIALSVRQAFAEARSMVQKPEVNANLSVGPEHVCASVREESFYREDGMFIY